ncbi:hypothetical protein QN416_24975, partial [Glaciimonas sp. Cout2]|uniref:hypothetical protein n=1 Tax=Glaciimonas sp. Cout2 TaxID=3048621 RepID=UPI002B231B98
STLVMLAAMTDSASGVFGLGPLPWAAILIAWGLTCSALLRRRTATGAPQNATPHGGAGQTMLLHHPLGLVVTAGQLMAHTVMSPGAAAAG